MTTMQHSVTITPSYSGAFNVAWFKEGRSTGVNHRHGELAEVVTAVRARAARLGRVGIIRYRAGAGDWRELGALHRV